WVLSATAVSELPMSCTPRSWPLAIIIPLPRCGQAAGRAKPGNRVGDVGRRSFVRERTLSAEIGARQDVNRLSASGIGAPRRLVDRDAGIVESPEITGFGNHSREQ